MNDAMNNRRTRIGMISNRRSGHNRDHLERIRLLLENCDNVVHIETDSEDDILAALSRLEQHDIDVLAINGGDGTIAAVLGCALEHRCFARFPTVLILPAGTANMTAADIGAPGKLLPAVRRFCAWAAETAEHKSTTTVRSLLRVQTSIDDSARYGMFLGMGAIIQGTEYTHQEIHSRGLRDDLSGALGVVRTVWGLLRQDPQFSQPVALNFSLDGEPTGREYQALLVAVSSLHRLFMGMRPFWGKETGALQLTVIEKNCFRFLRTFISIARGKPNRHANPQHGYTSHNANSIRISMEGKLNLDGEILSAQRDQGPVVITASPGLTFIKI